MIITNHIVQFSWQILTISVKLRKFNLCLLKTNKCNAPADTPEVNVASLFSQGCRSVEEFQCLNRIEEGTYGVVYRAKDKKTG